MQRAKRLLVAIMICVFAAISVTLVACNNGGESHNYKWEFNDNEHWRVCTDDGCGEEEGTKAAHVLVDDRCACGFVKEEVIVPAEHKHVFMGAFVKINETYHAHKCSADDCDNANAYDTNEANWEEHTYPTEGDNIYICSDCGYDNTPAHFHDFENSKLVDLGDGTHGIKCADPECPDEAVYDESVEHHVFDIVADDEDGENHHYECECGAVDEESHDDHYFVIKIDADGAHHHYECFDCAAIKADSQENHTYSIVAFGAETHWMECTCGAKQSGSEETHVYKFADATEEEAGSAYYTDEINHWKQCDCGAKEEFAHKFETWEVAVESTCSTYGYEESTCPDCGYVGNRDLPELDPTNHDYAEPKSINGEQHIYLVLCGHEGVESIYENHKISADGLSCEICDYLIIVHGDGAGITFASQGVVSKVPTDREVVIIPNYYNGKPVTTLQGTNIMNKLLGGTTQAKIYVIPNTITTFGNAYVFGTVPSGIKAETPDSGLLYEGDEDAWENLMSKCSESINTNAGGTTKSWDAYVHLYSETPAKLGITAKVWTESGVSNQLPYKRIINNAWHWVQEGDAWVPHIWTDEEIEEYEASASVNVLASVQNFVALAR